MKKICPLCGTENDENAKFCKECSESLVGIDSKKESKEERSFKNSSYKCPKCNASIEEGVKLCGNCKVPIVWKKGKPRLPASYVMQKTGCALTSLGCLIPTIVLALIIIFALVSSI